VARAIQLQRKESGHRGTFWGGGYFINNFPIQLNNFLIIFTSNYDSWINFKKSFHWKIIFVLFPNSSKHTPSLLPASRVTDLSIRGKNWLIFLKLHKSHGHVYICINVALLRTPLLTAAFNFQLSNNYSFLKIKYYFQELSQATEWTQVGPTEPAGTMLCRPAIQHDV
jgi:hypothetical protein